MVFFLLIGCPNSTRPPGDIDTALTAAPTETTSTGGLDCVPGIGPFSTVDITDYDSFCLGSEQDIFYAAPAVTITQATSAPSLTATFWKCDQTYMGEDKQCQIRIGSYEGDDDESLSRSDFIWERYEVSIEVSWDAWSDSEPWTASPEGSEKIFFLVCAEDNPGGTWNYWRSESPISVTKICP